MPSAAAGSDRRRRRGRRCRRGRRRRRCRRRPRSSHPAAAAALYAGGAYPPDDSVLASGDPARRARPDGGAPQLASRSPPAVGPPATGAHRRRLRCQRPAASARPRPSSARAARRPAEGDGDGSSSGRRRRRVEPRRVVAAAPRRCGARERGDGGWPPPPGRSRCGERLCRRNARTAAWRRLRRRTAVRRMLHHCRMLFARFVQLKPASVRSARDAFATHFRQPRARRGRSCIGLCGRCRGWRRRCRRRRRRCRRRRCAGDGATGLHGLKRRRLVAPPRPTAPMWWTTMRRRRRRSTTRRKKGIYQAWARSPSVGVALRTSALERRAALRRSWQPAR